MGNNISVMDRHSTIFPFLARGKRSITHPLHASGIYESLRLLMADNKTKHLIIITDMENNIQSLYRSITLAYSKRYNIWLLTSFSPYYNIEREHITPEKVEDIYRMYTARENILHRLRKLNIDIVELNPSMEGVNIVEKIRGKKK